MAFNWHKFPWTNLHELNLDWIIQTVKTLENNLSDAIGRFTEIANAAVGAERTERLAGDAALQTEIENGVYPTISRNINEVNTSINTERTERIEGDAALQSTIDKVIMPILTKLSKRTPCVVHVNKTDTTITAEMDEKIKTALLNRTPIVLAVDNTAENSLYNYHFLNCTIVPTEDNINMGFMLYFQTLDGIYKAHILNYGSGSGMNPTITFETT